MADTLYSYFPQLDIYTLIHLQFVEQNDAVVVVKFQWFWKLLESYFLKKLLEEYSKCMKDFCYYYTNRG